MQPHSGATVARVAVAVALVFADGRSVDALSLNGAGLGTATVEAGKRFLATSTTSTRGQHRTPMAAVRPRRTASPDRPQGIQQYKRTARVPTVSKMAEPCPLPLPIIMIRDCWQQASTMTRKLAPRLRPGVGVGVGEGQGLLELSHAASHHLDRDR